MGFELSPGALPMLFIFEELREVLKSSETFSLLQGYWVYLSYDTNKM